ncbi:MAG: hypothetical protein U0746_19190 [Gemmataceae bacterium]
MTSLLSKLFGTNAPRIRQSTTRARLGVESLDGRIMPMTIVEVHAIVASPIIVPKPAPAIEIAQTTDSTIAVSADPTAAEHVVEPFVGKAADHIDSWIRLAKLG